MGFLLIIFKFASVFRSGEYGMDMAFFTPDVRKQHSRRWHLGTLKISNKDADKIKWPEYPYLEIPEEFQQRFNQTILLAWRDADYEQDEIVPEIGEPPRNPPNASWLWMPLFLSFVILVPWSLLIWGWTKIRPINITQFWELFSEESSASNRAIAVGTNSFLVRIVAAVLFQASLFSMVFLLVLHWLYLDLFSFIKVFASLTLLASISAWFHLRDLAIIRSSSRSDPAVAASSISRKDK